MALADIQTIRAAIAARQLDRKAATRLAIVAVRRQIETDSLAARIYVGRALGQLDNLVDALQAGDLAAAADLSTVRLYSVVDGAGVPWTNSAGAWLKVVG